MEFLKRSADGLLAMPDWEKSRGARAEVNYAIDRGLTVFYPKDPADLTDVIAWARDETQ